MKLSNKILLGILLFTITVIVMHYVTLLIMFRGDHFAARYNIRDREPQRFFPEHIHTVNLTGFANVELVMSDTFYYEFFYAGTNEYGGGIDTLRNRLLITTNNGELVMNGDTIQIDTVMREGKQWIDTTHFRNENQLVIHVTGREQLIAHNTSVILGDSYKHGNFTIQLNNADLGSTNDYVDYRQETDYSPGLSYYERKNMLYPVDKLTVTATGNCTITMLSYLHIADMDVTMGNDCAFKDNACRIRQGTINYADSASFHIQAYNLKNLKMLPRGNVD